MKEEIKLTLAAEPFAKCFGILILENGDYMIEIDQSKIPTDFLSRLKKWYEDYYPYTGMSLKELESKQQHTEKLDKIGIELLNEIYENRIFSNLNIDKYIYYSRGIDKPIFELN
ncbi:MULTISPECIES: hypothetical protein [Flavobacteriaceae]|uniref:Uncharacterized protein n=2 Tax=Flavobacteriaceae TaxID=49546 RepID=S7XCQ1_9FLAO|nr:MULTISPECIES: hypothetical protein [Flavobacteriaceae]EPR73768.1 hypothetical protein ADIWIN_1230 [Winogradskyella psychrotolerans RS-3]